MSRIVHGPDNRKALQLIMLLRAKGHRCSGNVTWIVAGYYYYHVRSIYTIVELWRTDISAHLFCFATKSKKLALQNSCPRFLLQWEQYLGPPLSPSFFPPFFFSSSLTKRPLWDLKVSVPFFFFLAFFSLKSILFHLPPFFSRGSLHKPWERASQSRSSCNKILFVL